MLNPALLKVLSVSNRNAQEHILYMCLTLSLISDKRRNNSCFDIRGTELTFGGEHLRGELQRLNFLRSNVFQTDGQVLRLSVEKLNGHCAGQLFFGHWLGCVG